MPRYTCDPNVKLSGTTAQALLLSVLSENFEHIVAQHGLNHIEQDEWYPLSTILSILNEIASRPGATMDLVSLGIAAADNSPLPPEMEQLTPQDFFALYENVYQQRHQGGDAGRLDVRIVDEHTITVVSTTPYPDDTVYGLIYGFARRFAQGNAFFVEYDQDTPRRDQGGEETILHIHYE